MVQAPKLSPMSQFRSMTSIAVAPGFPNSLYGRNLPLNVSCARHRRSLTSCNDGAGEMAEDFSGKIALVTGGGNGIGAATCRAFAAAGARVAVLDRDAAAAERVAAEITGRNGSAVAYPIDVADRDAFARLTEGITEALGGIDILVNGAGTTVRRMIDEMRAEDWDRVIAVNLTDAFNGIRAVLPHMRARGGGAIVNIASIAGQRISFGGTANYSASKAGLLGLTRHAAYELAPDGIRVNAVCPGPTATRFGGATPT